MKKGDIWRLDDNALLQPRAVAAAHVADVAAAAKRGIFVVLSCFRHHYRLQISTGDAGGKRTWENSL